MSIDTKNQTEPTIDCGTAQQKLYPQLARTLTDNGYTVLPIKKENKAPAIRGWMKPDYKPPLVGFESCGIAIKTGCGEYPVITIDIDVTDENLAKEIHEMISEMLGPTIYRIGEYPKRILLYRLETAT